jgi:hypothetical protein
LSSDDEDVARSPEPDALTVPKGSADNGARVAGIDLAKTLIHGPIRTDAPNLPRPSIVDRVPIVSLARGHG